MSWIVLRGECLRYARFIMFAATFPVEATIFNQTQAIGANADLFSCDKCKYRTLSSVAVVRSATYASHAFTAFVNVSPSLNLCIVLRAERWRIELRSNCSDYVIERWNGNKQVARRFTSIVMHPSRTTLSLYMLRSLRICSKLNCFERSKTTIDWLIHWKHVFISFKLTRVCVCQWLLDVVRCGVLLQPLT